MGHARFFSLLLFNVVFLICIPKISCSQDENQPGTWMIFSVNSKLGEHWSIPTVGIIKHQNMLDEYGFGFVRSGARYHLNDKSSITAGISFLNANNYDFEEVLTNRSQIWLHTGFSLKTKMYRSDIENRLQWENRRTLDAANPNINNRIRYRFQYVRPISKKVDFKTFNEVFITIEEGSVSQNRLYFGLSQSLTATTKIDLGYMNRQVGKTNESMLRMALSLSIDFSKKDMAMALVQNESNP